MATYRIKELLQQRGLTQKWLAGQIGMEESELSRTIRRDALNDNTQEKIAAALHVRRCELFSDYTSCNTITCPNCGEIFGIETKKK